MLKKLYDLFSIVRFYEIFFNLTKRLAAPFEKPIMSFLNWRLGPEKRIVPRRGSTLQLVIPPDERAYVGWPVIKYILGPFLKDETVQPAGNGDQAEPAVEAVTCGRILTRLPLLLLVSALVILAMVLAVPFLQDQVFPNGLPDLNLGTLPSIVTENFSWVSVILILLTIVTLILIFWIGGLILTYWRYEWERRHTLYAFFLEGMYRLEAKFIGRAVGPFYTGDNVKVNFTRIEEMLEAESVVDEEDLQGGKKTSDAQDAWSQYLSKKYQVQTIKIPSRSASPDILQYVTYAPSTHACINQIIDLGRTYVDDFSSFQQKEVKAKSDDAGSGRYDANASSREAEKVWDDFSRLYPQSVQFYANAFDMEDPSIWDRKSGMRRITDGNEQPKTVKSDPSIPSDGLEVSQVQKTAERVSNFPAIQRKTGNQPHRPQTKPQNEQLPPKSPEEETKPKDAGLDDFWDTVPSDIE